MAGDLHEAWLEYRKGLEGPISEDELYLMRTAFFAGALEGGSRASCAGMEAMARILEESRADRRRRLTEEQLRAAAPEGRA